MPRMIFRLAAMLIFAAIQMGIGERAFARGGASGVHYNEAPSAGYNTTIVAYPPPLTSGRAADNCRWDEQTFTVPSAAGGTSPVKVMSCR